MITENLKWEFTLFYIFLNASNLNVKKLRMVLLLKKLLSILLSPNIDDNNALC